MACEKKAGIFDNHWWCWRPRLEEKNGNGNQHLCKARRHTFRPLLWSVCPGSLTASLIANCWMCLSAPFKTAGWKCLICSVTTQFSNDISIFHLSEYYLSIHAGLTTFCSFWHIIVDTLGGSVWVSTFAEVFVLPCRPPLTLSQIVLYSSKHVTQEVCVFLWVCSIPETGGVWTIFTQFLVCHCIFHHVVRD